ncbi:Y-family DNA polymerase [Terrihabitans sp. B22-R8]|uniref:Y-family DNA polymerase n=1 Tax=Terrihabitans sp. B22-R8 TaxID=3425128 RepID=UPI00403CBE21
MICRLSDNRRYLALWLPFLASDRARRQHRKCCNALDERPLIVLARVKNALRITHLDRKALSFGLHSGLTLADARARVPDLLIIDEDIAADAEALNQLAAWCDRYTPLVGIWQPDGLTLDITGCAHLLGGETNVLMDIKKCLFHAGFVARIAIAGTPDAAHALARFSPNIIVSSGEEAEAVRPLPLSALNLDAHTITALARAGLKTIADLADRPRAPLAARFGSALLDRLARTLGEIDTPISPRSSLPNFTSEHRFAEPIGRSKDILATIHKLAVDLQPMLEERGEGGRLFEASFFRADGIVRHIRVATSQASCSPSHLAHLFFERLDTLADPLDPGFGFDMIRLAALIVEQCLAVQPSLDRDEAPAEHIVELLDRLGARFSPQKVLRFASMDSHVPEWQAKALSGLSIPARKSDWPNPLAEEPPLRPLYLFETPEPVQVVAEIPDGAPRRFRWRRFLHVIARAEGPERIAPEWWKTDGAFSTRDYFRVEDREGHRFWLYREGFYGAETSPPGWYIHGLFA